MNTYDNHLKDERAISFVKQSLQRAGGKFLSHQVYGNRDFVQFEQVHFENGLVLSGIANMSRERYTRITDNNNVIILQDIAVAALGSELKKWSSEN